MRQHDRVGFVGGLALTLLLGTALSMSSIRRATALDDPRPTAPKIVIVDATKTYHGNPKKFKKPALVDSKAVYELIPAYKYIQDNNLTEDDPAYWFKMKEATKVFRKALKKLQTKKGYDLVGEIDSMYREDGAEIPDVTETVKGILTEGV